MHSCFAIRERRSGSVLSDHLELHFVELPKLKQALATNDEPSLVQWAKFLSAKSDGDLEQLAMESPILKRAKDALDALSADDIARMRAEQRETALRMAEFELGAAYSQGVAQGKAEGVAQGKAEGVAQGKAEGVAQGKAQLFTRLLCLKFGSLTESVEQRIAAATADDIDHWTQQLLQAKTLEDVFASR